MNVIINHIVMEKILEKIRSGQILSATEQMQIVKHKDKKYLRLYIENHCLCNKAEAAMVGLRNEELLRLYLKNNGLCPEAEEQLLALRDYKLLRLYYNEHDLPGFSPKELLKEYHFKQKKFC